MNCPGCHAPIANAASLAGKSAACPRCGARFRFPAAPPAHPAAAVSPQAPSYSPAAFSPAPSQPPPKPAPLPPAAFALPPDIPANLPPPIAPIAAPAPAYPLAAPAPAYAPFERAASPPNEAPAMLPLVGAAYRSAVSRRFQPATSLLDIFDIEFKRYLTPLIIKVTWAIALLLGSLAVIAITFLFLRALTFSPLDTAPRSSKPVATFGAAGDNDTFVLLRSILPFVMYCLSIAYVVLALLWLRVLCESLIVIFNIATILAEIRDGQQK